MAENELSLVDDVVCGNSIEILKKIPDNSVHLVLSDIPYGIGLDDWDVLHANTNKAYLGSSPAQQKAGKVFKSRGKPINGWSEADRKIPREYYEWCLQWMPEIHRILKPGGSVFIFAGRRFAHRCICAMEDSGLNFKDLLGWQRSQAMHRAQRLSVVFDRRGDEENSEKWDGWRLGNLRPVFEPIIWGFKPYKITLADNSLEHELGAYNYDRLTQLSGNADNIFKCDYRTGERGFHDAQKPVDLLKMLIEMVTREGHVVVDPFGGSGSTAVAAKECNRHYVSIDISPEYTQITKDRLESVNPSLF